MKCILWHSILHAHKPGRLDLVPRRSFYSSQCCSTLRIVRTFWSKGLSEVVPYSRCCPGGPEHCGPDPRFHVLEFDAGGPNSQRQRCCGGGRRGGGCLACRAARPADAGG